MGSQVSEIYYALQQRLEATLTTNRALIAHPGEKGTSVENEWLALFKAHLPYRYRADGAFVVDHDGGVSNQLDVVIYDRQYTPMLFNNSGVKYVPAESVYAVFEVKQELNADYIDYTGKKIASVRNLKRTSAAVVDVGAKKDPRELTYILGGVWRSDGFVWAENQIQNP